MIFKVIDACDGLLDIMIDSWTLLRLHGNSTLLVHILVTTVHTDTNRCHKSAWSISQGSTFYTMKGSKDVSTMCDGDGHTIEGRFNKHTYVRWRHLVAAFQMCV